MTVQLKWDKDNTVDIEQGVGQDSLVEMGQRGRSRQPG